MSRSSSSDVARAAASVSEVGRLPSVSVSMMVSVVDRR